MKNFEKEIQYLEDDFERVKKSIANIKDELKKASGYTQKFLEECGKEGITKVSVGVKSDKVPATNNFPFGCDGSVFQYPTEQRGKDGWVAIWGVVERLKISGGCGNTAQHQVFNDNLIEGVFELKGGKWRKVNP